MVVLQLTTQAAQMPLLLDWRHQMQRAPVQSYLVIMESVKFPKGGGHLRPISAHANFYKTSLRGMVTKTENLPMDIFDFMYQK